MTTRTAAQPGGRRQFDLTLLTETEVHRTVSRILAEGHRRTLSERWGPR